LVERELSLVNEGLRGIVECAGPEINAVGDYIFNGSGKRIRPALFLTAAYRVDVSSDHLIDAAIALELIHTASLLHDDVIDQAAIRRGKEAVHVKWGNKISVLSGDYLLSQAFKILVNYNKPELLEVVVDIVEKMSEGEIEQAFASIDSNNLESRYFQWIGKKSAAFFSGCCKAGSLMRDGSKEEQAAWMEYGYNLGMAFQLIDDLLDYTGKKSITGKPLYGDLNNRVITLPLIRTINVSSMNKPVNEHFITDTATSSQIGEVAQAVIDGEGPHYTYQKAEYYVECAAALIDDLNPESEEQKAILKQIPRDVLMRRN